MLHLVVVAFITKANGGSYERDRVGSWLVGG